MTTSDVSFLEQHFFRWDEFSVGNTPIFNGNKTQGSTHELW